MTRPAAISVPAGARGATRPYFARATGRSFQARPSDGATVIDFFDEVGTFGIGVADFKERLPASGDVVVRLNSPGGDVFDGLAIFNLLRAHSGHVRVEVLGVAASAASLIAMAADEIAMAEASFLMVHNAWTGLVGNAVAFDETAAVLRQVDAAMADVYAQRTGKTVKTVAEMMTAETWLNADDAIAAGFADERISGASARARFDLSVFVNAPAALAVDGCGEPTLRDLESALRDAGLSRSQARAVVQRGHGEPQRDADELADLAAFVAAQSI